MKLLLGAGCLLAAGLASAQTPAVTSTGGSAPAATTSALDLQVPDEPLTTSDAAGGADSPGTYYGDTSGNDGDRGTQVHGSFTTGIGYSKGYGTSTMNAASLDISNQSDDGKTFDMRINVEQSRGLFGHSYYGSRYRGY